MDKQGLMQVIIDQKSLPLPKELVSRSQYEQIAALVDNPQVIVICGVRRCGKSTILQVLRKNLKNSDNYINFDDERLVSFTLQDFVLLLEVFIELHGIQDTFYFDEIQNIEGWELFVHRLQASGKKIFISGSNAKLLSSELGTHLTGRNIAITIYPYSYREFLYYRDRSIVEVQQPTSTQIALFKKYFAEYLRLGGFPEYLNNQQIYYLQNLYENILYKDIIVRHKIHLEKAFREMVYYLASNNAKEFTYNALRKLIGIASTNTIADWCFYLEKSFLCFVISRFSYSVKEQINTAKKIYFIDQALAAAIGFRFSEDRGRVLEQIVLLQLKRTGKEIYFHKLKNECDFLLRDGYQISAAIQVCISLKDAKTRLREQAGLLEALELYNLTNGLIITEAEIEELELEYNAKQYKIKVIPCWKWLLTAGNAS